jgi:DNA gyrase subunit B
MRESVDNFLYDFLSKDTKRAKEIIEKILKAGKARLAAKRARDAARGVKEVNNIGGLPGKLADCSSKNPDDSEIMFVEGDSAAGSAKEGRDPVHQAILPIFGKIINADKSRLDKILGSVKMKDIIVALGCGIGDDFDISKLRYHKIILMADQDEDGRHIVVLHLTFSYRYLRPLIEAGYVYVANSPFYRLTKGKGKKIERKYALDEKVLAKMNTDGWVITRIKGLGELCPEELWETTMNPETRTLTRVTIEDAEAAESMLSLCMGDAVEPRRQFILEQLAS